MCKARDAKKCDSIGIALTKQLGIVIVDLEHCVTNGKADAWAQEIVDDLDSYTSMSTSGTGLHIVVRGSIPSNANRQRCNIELWDSGKMFSLTGQLYEGRGELRSRDLTDLHRRVVYGIVGPNVKADQTRGAPARGLVIKTPVDIDRLLDADPAYIDERYGGDLSEADLGAVSALARRTNGNRDEIERVWLESQLGQREKTQGREDYRQRTIDKALENFVPNPTPAVIPDELSGAWFKNVDDFLAEKWPEREALISQDGVPLILRKSINEVYSPRGTGKSLFATALIELTLNGGELMRFTSKGGYRVALIDAELPGEDLQARLSSSKNTGDRFKLFSPEFTQGKFPRLLDPVYQEKLIEQLDAFRPDLVVFDSLTACFRADTNDPTQNNTINDFLLRLRFAGYCVIFMHHAGKNGSQRGRTDIEDHADLVIKLSRLPDAEIGEFRVKLEFEKKRSKGVVRGFCFEHREVGVAGTAGFHEISDSNEQDVALMLMAGKSRRTIQGQLSVSPNTISRIKRDMEFNPQAYAMLRDYHEGQPKASGAVRKPAKAERRVM
jgi:archaellum biogenesis ATPase FlaH